MISFLVLASLSVPALETHPFGIGDMLAMDRISDPQVSPDAQWVAFTLRTTDLEANKGRTDIWIAKVDGSASKRLTEHEAADTSPRWLPDGKSLVFLSTRSGSSQVWKIAVDGGEPMQLSRFPLDVDNLLVFPDGERAIVTMEVYPDLEPAKALEETKKRDDEKAKKKASGKIYESLLFRHWDTWEDGKRSHVFTWNLAGGDPVDLMAGMDADSPSKPFGGAEEIAISPEGREVVFAALAYGPDVAWTTAIDLYAAPADGKIPARNVTIDNKAYDNSPVFSPDGRWVAYLAMQHAGYEADRTRIVLMDRRTGAARAISEAWDRSPSEITWSADGKTIYTTADNLGNKSLFAFDVETKQPKVLVEKGTSGSPRIAGDRVLYLHDTLHSPAEIHSVARDGSDRRAVTKINASKVAAARFGAYEQFSFPGAKNETVYGYVVKPADFDASKKYPVAMLIHGGPQGSFGDHFHYRWNPQAYAGAGYATIFIDFHGSTGYGQAFCDAIRGDWGGAPYEDLMKGLDFALSKYAFLDGTRVAALGASYGGYMINWIAGQTDRFQALVCHDGNLDERLAYFDTEELWFPEWDHGGTPWDNPEGYAKHNPIEHVKNWKTPMLVIHGALDYRVVDTQGMSTFTALQRRGIPSKLLYFPDENHWVLKPANSQLWHETVLGWLDRWLKDAPASEPRSGTKETGAGRR
ncbi:MAG: prolyl oligopeptidase family serine peptidase [Planctomycetota bacterium]